MVNMGIHVQSHLKEDMAWAVDKRLWVFRTKDFLKTVVVCTKELKGTN